MAKDPAFLFYPGDWQGGTMYLTHEQKGAYMDLLILQFNVGKFTLAQAKQVLSICFDVAWPMLQLKFSTDGIYYWNQRLSEEILKRQNFTKSRQENAKGKKTAGKSSKAYAKHMEDENRNENVIKDNWIEWGKLIVQNNDQHWDAMRGRRVTQDEMDAFLSVATRNKWTMNSQNEFRISLKGFSANGKVNGSGKNPSKIH
jgi:uncharacterized protein YdaU (DUF1376 family)